MREGDDPRDIYWRKSTIVDQLVLRERARETRPDVELCLDVIRPQGADDGYAQAFERRVREIASRAVAHIKRGDGVVVSTTLGERVRADRTSGTDPVLRFLALLDPIDEAQIVPRGAQAPPGAAGGGAEGANRPKSRDGAAGHAARTGAA
jgi:uncharacterized protein (DUF58 family)